jgi:ATP/ADP translocase
MFKRTLIFASAFAVLSAAIIINLAILDIISFQELRQSLRKILAVIAVSAIALLLLHKLFNMITQGSPDNIHDSQRFTDSSPAGEAQDKRNENS